MISRARSNPVARNFLRHPLEIDLSGGVIAAVDDADSALVAGYRSQRDVSALKGATTKSGGPTSPKTVTLRQTWGAPDPYRQAPPARVDAVSLAPTPSHKPVSADPIQAMRQPDRRESSFRATRRSTTDPPHRMRSSSPCSAHRLDQPRRSTCRPSRSQFGRKLPAPAQ